MSGVLTFNVQAFEAAPPARVGAWLRPALEGVDVLCVQEDIDHNGDEWVPGFRLVTQKLQRHATVAVDVTCPGAVVRVVCSHFSGGRFDDPLFRRLRGQKVAELDAILERYRRVDVLAADFNGSPDAKAAAASAGTGYVEVGADLDAWTEYFVGVHDRLRREGYVAAPNRAGTSARTTAPVDWVYFDPRAVALTGDVRRFDAIAAGVSDHVALFAAFREGEGSRAKEGEGEGEGEGRGAGSRAKEGEGGASRRRKERPPLTLAMQSDVNARLAAKWARLRALSQPAWRRMGDAEKMALVRYQTSGYTLINSLLRKDRDLSANVSDLVFWLNPKTSWKWQDAWDPPRPPFGSEPCDVLRSPISAVPELVRRLGDELVSTIRTLDAMFDTTAPRLPADMVLYRGETGPFAAALVGSPARTVAYPSFLSTTLDPNVMSSFMNRPGMDRCAMVVRVPAGTPFMCLDGLSGGEMDTSWELEIMFPRGAQLKMQRARRVAEMNVDRRLHRGSTMPLVHAELATFVAAAADAIDHDLEILHVDLRAVKREEC